MLTHAAAHVLYEVQDVDEDRYAAYDYAWMVSLNVIGSTSRSWRSFRAGYGAGGEIGKRRYAMSHPLPESASQPSSTARAGSDYDGSGAAAQCFPLRRASTR